MKRVDFNKQETEQKIRTFLNEQKRLDKTARIWKFFGFTKKYKEYNQKSEQCVDKICELL